MSELPHLAEVIEEEMQERGWDRDKLAFMMQPDATLEQWQINRLALDFFLEVRCPCMMLGSCAAKFSRAFGVDAAFFQNMDEQWRKAQPPCK